VGEAAADEDALESGSVLRIGRRGAEDEARLALVGSTAPLEDVEIRFAIETAKRGAPDAAELRDARANSGSAKR
jgi:hypothetical protein